MNKLIFLTVLSFTYFNTKCMEEALFYAAKKTYVCLQKNFTISNDDLCHNDNPIEIYQTPTFNGTIEQQTCSSVKEIIKRLERHGKSLSDVQQCLLYTTNQNDFQLAQKTLETACPDLHKIACSKITKLPCKVAFIVKTSKTKNKKLAKL